MSTKFGNSPHSLEYSPMTMAFDKQFPNEKLEEIPALVSINEKAIEMTPASTISKRISPLNANKRKDFKNLNSPKNKATNSNHKKLQKNPITNSNKYLFNVGAKRKTNSSPFINKNSVDEEPSLAESVGLDLEEYSSIHKLEHASPYFSQDLEEEDQEYAVYLMKEENEKMFLNSGVPKLFLDHENNELRRPALDSKDTYNEFLDNDLTFEPQFKVKRIQSTGAEPLSSNFKTHFNLDKPAMSQKEHVVHQEFNTQNHEIPRIEEEESEYKKSSKKTSTANIHYFHNESKDEFFSISKDMLQRFFKKELIEIDEDDQFQMKTQIKSKTDEQTEKNEELNLLGNIFTTEPEWIRSKSSSNLLRLILTKNNRLLQYLKYLTELEILLKKKDEKEQLDKICDRSDITETNQYEQKSVVKVYYDKEANLAENIKQSNSPNKIQRYDSPRKWILTGKKDKDKPFSAVCSVIADTPSPKEIINSRLIRNKLVDIAEGRMEKELSKSPIKPPKENETKSNDFELKREKQQHSPISLYSINSQIDIPSTFSHNQIDSHGRANASRVIKPIHQIEAVKLLKLLLVKLESKKCNLYVKHGRENEAIENRSGSPNSRFSRILEEEEEDIESISRRGTQRNEKQTERFENKSNEKESIQIMKIEFEEYLEPVSKERFSQNKQEELSGNRLITYSQRIKELNEELESKDKYIYEIKSNYDYIINNQIKSISNLSSKKGAKWDQHQSLTWKEGLYTSITSPLESNQRNFKNVNDLQDNLQSEDSLVSKEGRKESSFENNGQNKKNKSLERSGESELENQRLSQPMTFKMSRKGINDSREEDQWIGNSLSLNKEGNDFRYSSPEKE